LAALGLQDEGTRLAVEVDRRDGVDLRLRIGLNSGHVIAGEIGSGALGYTASRFRRQSSGHLAYHMPKQRDIARGDSPARWSQFEPSCRGHFKVDIATEFL
jgi:hypothetical protein